MKSPTLSRNIGKTAWWGYSPDLSDAQIVTLYTARYGQAPQEVLRGRSVVLCGPVGGKVDQSEPLERSTGLPGAV